MKRLLLFFTIVFAVFCVDTSVFAQQKAGNKYHYGRKRASHGHSWVWSKRRQYTSVGINFSAINYFGDITPRPNFMSTDIRMTHFSTSIFYQKRFYPQVTGRFMVTYGRLQGADSLSASKTNSHDVFRYIRNLSFRNDIYEVGTFWQFDLIEASKMNKEFYQRPKQFIPYISLGVATLYHNPKAKAPEEFGGEYIPLQPLGTEGQGRKNPVTGVDYGDKYSKVQMAIPVGFGIRKRVTDRIDVAFELNWRFLMTDYLDDVSKKYLNKGAFAGDEDGGLAWAMHDRSLEGNREQALKTGNLAYVPNVSYFPVAGSLTGEKYKALVGFGNDEFPDNIRGNSKENDVYLTAGLQLIYIIPPQGARCPIRFK